MVSLYTTIDAILGPLGLTRIPILLPIIPKLFPIIATIFIQNWVAFDQIVDSITRPECEGVNYGLHYDFIVVGAGSAGMIVATRLANNTKGYSVLLLEAGGEPSPLNYIPIFSTYINREDANCWIYPSERQVHAGFNGDDGRVKTTRGRMLGGSSGTNTMIYMRGNKEDFNGWAEMLGDPEWSYEAVLPYFKKSQNYAGFWPFNATFHGKDGLINVEASEYQLATWDFLNAAVEKGYRLGDVNGEDQEVFSPIDMNTQSGGRESTYQAYYRDTGKPRLLTIKKYALATKIEFDDHGQAIGVTYERHNCISTAYARREVILSAGVFGSAQLLMLSGIGPKDHLQSLGIPISRDLPVGDMVQDHPFTLAGPFLKSPALDLRRDSRTLESLSYQIDGSGPWSSNGVFGAAYLTSPYAQPKYPDIQFLQVAFTLNEFTGRDMNIFFGFNATLVDHWLRNNMNQDARVVYVTLGRPRSTGVIRLRSRNPRDLPINDPKYLSHPDDVEALLWGLKKAIDLFENSQDLNAPMISTPIPGCEAFHFRSDEYYRCGIRRMTGSIFHHVGSCGMGRVVDSRMRVFGVPRLRVIDSSVMPKVTNGNTNAPTMMIAEKGVDFIKKDWGL